MQRMPQRQRPLLVRRWLYLQVCEGVSAVIVLTIVVLAIILAEFVGLITYISWPAAQPKGRHRDKE